MRCRPPRSGRSMTKTAASTSAPISFRSFTAASAVPPVAIRSSTRIVFSPGLMRVAVHLHLVEPVFERIGDAHRLVRKLAALADRHEAGGKLMRDGAADDEAARLDAGDLVDLRAGPGMHQLVHRAAEGARIAEQRGDVAEEDPRLRIVRNRADRRLQIQGHRCHGTAFPRASPTASDIPIAWTDAVESAGARRPERSLVDASARRPVPVRCHRTDVRVAQHRDDGDQHDREDDPRDDAGRDLAIPADRTPRPCAPPPRSAPSPPPSRSAAFRRRRRSSRRRRSCRARRCGSAAAARASALSRRRRGHDRPAAALPCCSCQPM